MGEYMKAPAEKMLTKKGKEELFKSIKEYIDAFTDPITWNSIYKTIVLGIRGIFEQNKIRL